MKRIEYRFKGKVVCVVDEGRFNNAWYRCNGEFTQCTIQDAHALAKAHVAWVKAQHTHNSITL